MWWKWFYFRDELCNHVLDVCNQDFDIVSSRLQWPDRMMFNMNVPTYSYLNVNFSYSLVWFWSLSLLYIPSGSLYVDFSPRSSRLRLSHTVSYIILWCRKSKQLVHQLEVKKQQHLLYLNLNQPRQLNYKLIQEKELIKYPRLYFSSILNKS